jgi:hypothetical protein
VPPARDPPAVGLVPLAEFSAMTLIWFIVWLIANNIGDHEPLLFDPVNWWAGTLLLVIALDLSRQHVPHKG